MNANQYLCGINLWVGKNLYVCSIKKNVFDIDWNSDGVKYGDVYLQSEKEFSAYNFDYANTESLLKNFEIAEKSKSLLEKKFLSPAYDQCLKASHIFNLLNSRGVIAVAERTGYINRSEILLKDLVQNSWKIKKIKCQI